MTVFARSASDTRGRAPKCEMTSARAAEVEAVGQAVQKARRVLVAGAGGIDDTVDRVRVDDMHLVAGDDDRPPLTAGQGRDLAVPSHALERGVEVVDLVERADLGLVGEQHVDLVLDEGAELRAVPLDTERVGQRERDRAARVTRRCGCLPDGVLGRRLVPEVALEVRHLSTGDDTGVDVLRTDERRRAEVRALGALRVRCHHHEAAARRRSAGGR